MNLFDELGSSVGNDSEEVKFDSLNAVETADVVTDAGDASAKKSSKKDPLADQVAKELAKELVANDELRALFKSRVNDLFVTNTLAFSDKGGQILAGYDEAKKNAKNKATRKLEIVPEIVGYNVKNQGEQPIECDSQVWHQNEAGKFVAEPTKLVINPGEEKSITKRDMLMITSQPEFSGEFANGVMTTKLKTSEMAKYAGSEGGFDFIASKYFIRFTDGGVSVHDDAVKINISHQEEKNGNTVWVVNDEYKAQFGFLENEPEAKEKATKSAAPKEKKANKIKLETRNVNAAFLAKALKSAQENSVQAQ